MIIIIALVVLVPASFISLIDVKTDVCLVILPVRGASLVGQLERLLFFLEGGLWSTETQLQIEMDWYIDFSFYDRKKKSSGIKCRRFFYCCCLAPRVAEGSICTKLVKVWVEVTHARLCEVIIRVSVLGGRLKKRWCVKKISSRPFMVNHNSSALLCAYRD